MLLGTSAGQVDRTPNHSTSNARSYMRSSNAYSTYRTFRKRRQSAATCVTFVTKSPPYQKCSKIICTQMIYNLVINQSDLGTAVGY